MNSTNVTLTSICLINEEEEESLTDKVLYYMLTVNLVFICEAVDIFGTVTNIINIVVFVKMGFTEHVNISFLGLAVSDLCSLLVLHWLILCFNPLFTNLDLPFDPYDVQYLTAGFPHVLFTRITACITAFITLERCLCIYLPLKVKSIVTSKRVKVVICSIYAVNFLCAAPFYYSSRLGPKFFPDRNKTLLGLIFTEDQILVDRIVFATMHLLIPFGTLIIVVVCTFIIVVKMRQKARWRAQTSTSQKSGELSSRDQRVTRMVVTISTLFLVCITPMTMCFIPMVVLPDFSIQGKYRKEFVAFVSFNFILESINSSVNILIYYNMNRKFRETLKSLLYKPVREEN